MTQISRPFQIALAALALVVAVWFVALRGHSSSSESSGSSSSAAAPAAASHGPSSASPAAPGGGSVASQGKTYTGAAPGVAGLSRAIARAQGAVKQSQQNAQQLQQKSQQASQQSGAQSGSQSSSASATHAAGVSTHGSATGARSSKTVTHAKVSTPAAKSKGEPVMQAAVEAELKQGRTVAVLFWNPKGTVDAVVRRELAAARRALGGKLAVHVARSSEVGSFGSFTRTVRVYATPTILLINTHGKTSSSAGLIDAFGIEQAVREVKRAK